MNSDLNFACVGTDYLRQNTEDEEVVGWRYLPEIGSVPADKRYDYQMLIVND